MDEIEKRALEYANFKTGYEPTERRDEAKKDYEQGAIDQRIADIEKIVKYAEDFNKQNEEMGIDARIDIDSIRKWAVNILIGDVMDEYLLSKIKQATPTWKDIDVDEYIKQFRE